MIDWFSWAFELFYCACFLFAFVFILYLHILRFFESRLVSGGWCVFVICLLGLLDLPVVGFWDFLGLNVLLDA